MAQLQRFHEDVELIVDEILENGSTAVAMSIVDAMDRAAVAADADAATVTLAAAAFAQSVLERTREGLGPTGATEEALNSRLLAAFVMLMTRINDAPDT